MFDFFVSCAGFAVPVLAGMEKNRILKQISMQPFYASIEANTPYYPVFRGNLKGRNALIFTNALCMKTFGLGILMNTFKTSAEMILIDPNEKVADTVVLKALQVLNFNDTEVRIIALQVHPRATSRTLYKFMKTVCETTNKWTEVYYRPTWYKWFPHRDSSTKFAIFVRAAKPKAHPI